MARYLYQRFGDYRLTRLLGSGGFAEVYEAEHLHLPGVKVAVKLLKGSFTPQQIGELRKEAHIISGLDHPHIVQLRTFSIEHAIPYLVMSYAQDGSLDKRHPQGTLLSLPKILSYVGPIAQALQYAHQRNIVHRDLKPANLLLTKDGRVQVADFGIAIVVHSSTSRTIQEIAGTWAYMAPEQFDGLAAPASDQYSLAIMVYQWLCGNVPFNGNGNAYLIPQQQKEQLPSSLREKLPDLSPGIEYVVMKALAKDPGERFASIQEFAEALREASKPQFVPAPGQRLGDYRLVRKIGEGGFAEVYEAEHLHLGTRAAIKLLKGTFSPKQIEGLRQEARSVMQLDHPHIIRAYGFSIERDIPYLVLAYAHGGSLATRYLQGIQLPLETILAYMHQIAAALQYAHDQGITHRDIKPDNILLAQDGRVLVTDFGIAIMAETAQASQEIVGSWVYMAPEQFEGRAEYASDQYSLGIMIYQWLCGKPPFTGKGSIYALPYQQMNEPPPSLCESMPTLSPKIEKVVMKALAKKPEERFASVYTFAHAFEDACITPAAGTTLHTYEHLGGEVNTVTWSPDGTLIASGGKDATVRIWDVSIGQTLLTRRGHSDKVNAVAWSPDGRLVISGSDDKTVQVWEADTGNLVRLYEGHSDKVNAVAWSPDGRLIASGSDDRSMQVWEATTGKLLHHYKSNSASVKAVAWSPDGRLIASGSFEGVVRVWETATGNLHRYYRGHFDDRILYLGDGDGCYPSVDAVAWSPDGRLIASGSGDKSVHVWEAVTGKLQHRYEDHSSGVNAVVWSPDGYLIVSGGFDNRVHVWEAATGKPQYCYEGHPSGVKAMAWSPDGYLIASGGFDNNVQIWEAATGKSQHRDEGHFSRVNAVVWSPNGRFIASGSFDQKVQIWEAATGKLDLCYKGHSSRVNAVVWSPDGRLIASASGYENVWDADNSVQIWEAATGKLQYCYEGHFSKVRAVAWSPDGQLVASASGDEDSIDGSDNSIHVWEVTTGKLLRRYEGYSSAFDDEYTMDSSEDSVRVWEAVTGKLLHHYEGYSVHVDAMAWSPNGWLVTSGRFDNSVNVWEVTTGKLLCRYEGHSRGVNSVTWSPNGRLVASASNDNSVQVWEATSGKLLHHYKSHSAEVKVVAWSLDGKLVASASSDKTVQVWEAFTGKLLLTYRDHFTPVFALAWSPDGTKIASASYEVYVWQVL